MEGSSLDSGQGGLWAMAPCWHMAPCWGAHGSWGCDHAAHCQPLASPESSSLSFRPCLPTPALLPEKRQVRWEDPTGSPSIPGFCASSSKTLAPVLPCLASGDCFVYHVRATSSRAPVGRRPGWSPCRADAGVLVQPDTSAAPSHTFPAWRPGTKSRAMCDFKYFYFLDLVVSLLPKSHLL